MTPAQRLASVPVARLATVGPDGAPHVVPMVFALVGEDEIVSAVDHKPKRTRALRRLANIEHEPRVSVLADHYEPDWSQLWWVRADGVARLLPAYAEGLQALAGRYPQYREKPPAGPFVVITVERWATWTA
ncbi:TIGR03668 family PPOX class F420-dependent oxidoreductase [Actinoplanes sp. Pm04-4]|uniref:TIGR03668 family PPOX class F420-dependent oxidoreductase n=1 Tax=Paractinoplanes pyxinae TaxID=2997416 RepID=A0ABT4AXJ4_9ACTN|nr:TIGR03668 family PPOX class F420-dependent oxidoreductase [Actinoplanes pyxinae]MCY1138946.1 TIGR03668 family PPOX class F420-dependent oxidoreductase [Actinoplanes pyxinae]